MVKIEDVKVGGCLVAKDVIYKIIAINSGTYLLDRVWSSNPQGEDVTQGLWPKKNVFTRSALKHKLIQEWFKYVPKEKVNTIAVLYS